MVVLMALSELKIQLSISEISYHQLKSNKFVYNYVLKVEIIFF